MHKLIVLIYNFIIIPYKLLHHISIFSVVQNSKIDKRAAISSNVKFYRSKIGKYSYVDRNCFISDVEIGNFCSIAENVYIGGASHPTDWVSTSPVFHNWSNIMKKNFSKHEFIPFNKTVIENDVWIGKGVLVKAGVKISNGAIVGMGSVLTKNVGPYEIWAGNPAKMIGKRFDDETIAELLNSNWWIWDDKKVSRYSIFMNNINSFREEVKK